MPDDRPGDLRPSEPHRRGSVVDSIAAASAEDIDMPRAQRGGNPQRLLLTLLGDYWYGHLEPLPSASLVRLLGEFAVTDVGARAALSRLARRGLLVLSKRGRRTYYGLSPKAAAVLQEGRQRILSFGASEEAWTGRWTVAAFSIPEDQRDTRHSLRVRLRWLGLAPLYDGVWVSPHDRTRLVADALHELEVGNATVFVCEVAGSSPAVGDPIRAWDLTELRTRYEGMISRYEPLRRRVRHGRMGTAEALVTRTTLMDDWRNFPNLDPELPSELLPGGWPRTRARAVFVDLYDGLAALAEAHVRRIVSEQDQELASLVRSHGSTVAEGGEAQS